MPDARGGYVRLKDVLAAGPVVVSFYRGGWCPDCNLRLRAAESSPGNRAARREAGRRFAANSG